VGASRSDGVVAFARAGQTLGGAVAAFLAQPGLAASTRRSYQQTLDRLEWALGRNQPPATITTDQVTAAVTAAWDGCAPATWNRHVATVRSFTSYCRRHQWLTDDLTAGMDRRVEPADRTKAIPLPQLEQLWHHDDIAVREKALWRFLYETAARATEALSINVEDLDLDNKRVRGALQGRRHRLAPLPNRLCAVVAAADRRADPWTAVPGRPGPRIHPCACRHRPLSRDRPCPTELSSRRSTIPAGIRWMDSSPAAPFGPHPPGRAERQPTAAHGQEPPHQPAVLAALRPPWSRSGCGAHRGH
jgi:integrase